MFANSSIQIPGTRTNFMLYINSTIWLVIDEHVLVSQNSKVGRPRKIDKALENHDKVEKRNHNQKVGKTVGKISTKIKIIVNIE